MRSYSALNASCSAAVTLRLTASTFRCLYDLKTEIDERSDFGRRVFARGVKGEEREALAVPAWEEVDQDTLGQKVANDAPANELGNAGARDALLEHRLGVCEGERSCRRHIGGFLAPNELPIEGSLGIRVQKLQAPVTGEIAGVFGSTESTDVTRRGQGQDRGINEFSHDQARATRRPEANRQVSALRHEVPDVLAGHELHRELGIAITQLAQATGKHQRQDKGIDVHFEAAAHRRDCP